MRGIAAFRARVQASPISDDVVWLAHAAAYYITVSGDRDILHEKAALPSRGRSWGRSTMPSSLRSLPPKLSRFFTSIVPAH